MAPGLECHTVPGAGWRLDARLTSAEEEITEWLSDHILDSNALQLAPDTLPVEEEPVLLECGLRDIKKRSEQLNHICVHQPAQELGQDCLSQTVLSSRDRASP